MCVHTATQATVYYRTNGKWPDLTLFHRLSSSSHNLPLPRHLLREEGIIVRALSVYWHYRTYRIATKTNFITSAFTVRWMSSSHHTNKHCFTVPNMPTSSQSLPKKNQLHFFRFSRKHNNRQETLCTPQDEKFCQCSDVAPQYKNCRRVATVVVVAAAALRGRRQQRSVTFATYLSLPRV